MLEVGEIEEVEAFNGQLLPLQLLLVNTVHQHCNQLEAIMVWLTAATHFDFYMYPSEQNNMQLPC